MRTSKGCSIILSILLASMMTGCLPSSCNKVESRRLLPADSVSRAYALTLPVDTLKLVKVITQNDSLDLDYPRTLGFAPNGLLWVADTGNHLVSAFDSASTPVYSVRPDSFDYPYLAGFRGDTVFVFSPEAEQIRMLNQGVEVGSFSVPDLRPERGALQFVGAGKDGLYYKVVAEGFDGYLSRLSFDGIEQERIDLDGPYWRYAGLLRAWGDSLMSLSGYRPIIDVLSSGAVPNAGANAAAVPNAVASTAATQDATVRDATDSGGAVLDSLVLFGFDSPMLPRSRSFLLGEEAVPPLLTSSAVGVGGFLFVLNMRPGWLNVDVYDRSGRLQHILTQASPSFNRDYYPTDIAVRRLSDVTWEFAITVVEPVPSIERYIWIRL